LNCLRADESELRDLAGRRGERLAHDLDAGLLVVVLGLDALELLGGAEQGDAAARHDAFLNRRAILALLHLDFGRAADADHRDAARELGQTLLQLLAVALVDGLLKYSGAEDVDVVALPVNVLGQFQVLIRRLFLERQFLS
jgi:hypothetical protein